MKSCISVLLIFVLSTVAAFGADVSKPAGTILREVWDGLPGTALTDLTGSPDYPNYPSRVEDLHQFASPPNDGESYGAVIRGYVYPPKTGMYIFSLVADDCADLWLGTSDTATSLVKVASVPSAVGPEEWSKFPSQTSRSVMLVNGRRYFIQALHRQGAGAAHLAVGWRMPEGKQERPILGEHLSPFAPPKVAARPVKPLPNTPGHHKLVFDAVANGRKFKMPYLLYIPKGYDTSRDLKPLLIFLHGAGECGTDWGALFVHGPDPRLRDDQNFRDFFPCLGLTPQCPPGMRWDDPGMARAVITLLDDVSARARVDKSRVYMTGLSMGGRGTWLVAHEAPDRFAAIAPISAVAVQPEKAVEHFKKMSVWIICGGEDGEFTSGSKQMNDVLKAGGVDVQLTVVPGEGHGVWPTFYNDNKFYEWLLKHQKPK